MTRPTHDRDPSADPSPAELDGDPTGRARARLVTRRSLLVAAGAAVVIGAGGVAASTAGVIPGRSFVERKLGLVGAAGEIPDLAPGPAATGTFLSAARRGADTGWTISYPPGSSVGDRLPVIVSLHGYGGDHRTSFGDRLGLDRFQAQAVSQGTAGFAVASVDGGDAYWHPRVSGEDPRGMLVEEFLPLLADQGLDTSRLGLLGWSMGAFGALLLASDLGPARVAAVGAMSVALWPTADRAASGAFDDADDFARNDLLDPSRARALGTVAARIDCGTADAFCPNNRRLVDTVTPRPTGVFTSGAHDMAYWRRVVPDQLAFLGARLG